VLGNRMRRVMESNFCRPGAVLVVFGALFCGCPPSADAPRDAAPALSGTHQPPIPTASTKSAGPSAASPPRELHPIGGGTSCLEMYSACRVEKDENVCTSAPFVIECNETRALPSNGELLHCVCP
jgi:hypothetical protein